MQFGGMKTYTTHGQWTSKSTKVFDFTESTPIVLDEKCTTTNFCLHFTSPTIPFK